MPAITGVSTLLLVIPLQAKLAGKIAGLRARAASQTDERVRITGQPTCPIPALLYSLIPNHSHIDTSITHLVLPQSTPPSLPRAACMYGPPHPAARSTPMPLSPQPAIRQPIRSTHPRNPHRTNTTVSHFRCLYVWSGNGRGRAPQHPGMLPGASPPPHTPLPHNLPPFRPSCCLPRALRCAISSSARRARLATPHESSARMFRGHTFIGVPCTAPSPQRTPFSAGPTPPSPHSGPRPVPTACQHHSTPAQHARPTLPTYLPFSTHSHFCLSPRSALHRTASQSAADPRSFPRDERCMACIRPPSGSQDSGGARRSSTIRNIYSSHEA